MNFRWTCAPAQPALGAVLRQQLQLSPLLAQCLLNRGLSEPDLIRRFLDPRLSQLADPFLLPGMDAAVTRLFQARDRSEPLVIFGDYDVDGISATALLAELLTPLGWTVHCYLPHRREEGYGLSRAGVENCLAKHPVRLLLAVDCGSSAPETVAWMNTLGVDTLIVDHHQVSHPAPQAVALVNPRSATTDPTPFGELASVGLAFKLAHALVKRGRDQGRAPELACDIRHFLDLVALGTVADLVPLTGENRVLVRAGLDRLNRTVRPGLLALKAAAQIQKPITGYEVGFQLAPRLNAAGRLENAVESLDLLLTKDPAAAEPIARRLNAHNRERQDIERTIARQVKDTVKKRFVPERDFVIIEGHHDWHIGVVGIVASRVLQEFHRPTIILGGDGEAWRGSGRSMEGFDLAAALRACDDILFKHGGHAMAAGVSMAPENLEALRTRLNDAARRVLTPEMLQPALRLDDEVALADLTLQGIRELERLEQTGIGNPQVQLFARDVSHQRPLLRMGAEKQHVKMWITDGATTLEAVWWGAGHRDLPVGRFDLAFSPRLNDYNGRVSVQLHVLDWRPVQG